jgi:hypothetical protein
VTAGGGEDETDGAEKEECGVQCEEVNEMGAAPAPPEVEEDSPMRMIEATGNAADDEMEEGEVQGEEVMEDDGVQNGAASGYARGDESDLTPPESDNVGVAGVAESVSHARVLQPRKRVSYLEVRSF